MRILSRVAEGKALRRHSNRSTIAVDAGANSCPAISSPQGLEGIEGIVKALVASQPAMRGPFNLQGMRRADGRFAVFEINGRFGGGFPLAHQAGGRFTRWVLEEGVLGREVQEHATEFGWRMMRCDRSIFVRDGA